MNSNAIVKLLSADLLVLVNSLITPLTIPLVISLTVFSCRPKDIDLKAVQTVAQQGNNPKIQDMTMAEKNNFTAVSIERAFEPLHYLKAKLNSTYAEENDLIMISASQLADQSGGVGNPSEEIEQELIESKSKDLKKTTNTQLKISYQVTDFSMEADGRLKQFVIVKNIFKKTSMSSIKGKDNFDSQSYSERMIVRATDVENIYVIKVSRSDNTNSKKDKNSLINLESKIKIQWDGHAQSLDQALKIVYFDLTAERLLNKLGQVRLYDSAPENLTIQLGQCLRLDGWIKAPSMKLISGKMTEPLTLEIIDSNIRFSASQESKSDPCQSRSVVNMARLL